MVKDSAAIFDKDASQSRRPPEDRFPKIMDLALRADACYREGQIPRAALLDVLRQARGAFVTWYTATPREGSALLLGDDSLTDLPERRKRLPNGRQPWGSHYLWTEERLVALAPSERGRARGLGELMMQVDALADRLMLRLAAREGEAPGAVGERDVDTLCGDFGAALAQEAEAWAALVPRFDRLKDVKLAAAEGDESQDVQVKDRLKQTSRVILAISARWGHRSNDQLRERVGVPWHDYLTRLRRAEAGAVEDEQVLATWAVPLDVPSLAERGALRRIDEQLRELIYDRLNVRALYAMREAETRWLEILPDRGYLGPSEGEAVPGEEALFAAQRALARAVELTDDDEVRLSSVAALVNASGIVFAQPINQRRDDDARRSDPAISTGGHLGALALCFMNNALLTAPAEASCVPLASQGGRASAADTSRCAPTPVTGSFVNAVPPGVAEAYRRVLGSLLVAGDPGLVNDRTRCELQKVLHAPALASLRADPTLFDAALALLRAQDIEMDKRQLGGVVAAAIRASLDATKMYCLQAGLGAGCSPRTFDARLAQEKDEAVRSYFERWKASYCEAARSGVKAFVTRVERRAVIDDTVSPLREADLRAYRAELQEIERGCDAGQAPSPGAGRSPATAQR
ncbi:hypothetical protein WMF45_44905 [Sorangium sp. So ce448]|uniref:hypothetical protein n=1 Tax=Sorangium sp. So ce448 TaxID=3133314 RepID=UPI003F5D8556